MTDAKIMELEGQVIALRGALTDAADALDIYTVNYAPAARKALTDTAQAGREAIADIQHEILLNLSAEIAEGAKSPGDILNGLTVQVRSGLRNGGSEKFFADEDKPLLAELDKASERHVRKFERNGGSDGE